MKRTMLSVFPLAIFFLIFFAGVAATQPPPPRDPVALPAPAPLIQNALARGGLSLNGDWHYFTDPYDEGTRGAIS
jgi:hypothetical protein